MRVDSSPCSVILMEMSWITEKEQQNKSAITDHVTRENHVIDWDHVKVIGHESDRKSRWIKEAISIRKDMYEPGLRVVPLTIQLQQAPSL